MKDSVIAYHEAGHAVIAFYNRVRVLSVTIASPHGRKKPRGRTRTVQIDARLYRGNSLRARECFEQHIRAGLAGEIAQRRVAPRTLRSRQTEDGDECGARHLLADLTAVTAVTVPAVGYVIEQAYRKLLKLQTERMVELFWPKIVAVAKALLHRRKLSGDEVRQIIDGMESSPT